MLALKLSRRPRDGPPETINPLAPDRIEEGAVIDFLERRRVVATKTFIVKMQLAGIKAEQRTKQNTKTPGSFGRQLKPLRHPWFLSVELSPGPNALGD